MLQELDFLRELNIWSVMLRLTLAMIFGGLIGLERGRKRRAAGFRHWVPDVCRHTFATYHAAMFRNLPELQLEMGHRDTSLLRSRYMVPSSRKDAELFWKACR